MVYDHSKEDTTDFSSKSTTNFGLFNTWLLTIKQFKTVTKNGTYQLSPFIDQSLKLRKQYELLAIVILAISLLSARKTR